MTNLLKIFICKFKYTRGDIMNLNDFGVLKYENHGSKNTDDYETKYMQDIDEKDHITGEISISPIKDGEFGKKFYIWIIDHDGEEKWGIKIQNPFIIEEDGVTKIYTKDGRLYKFLDSLFKEILGTKYKKHNSYTIDFEIFRESIKTTIKNITVHAVPSEHPKAKYPDFEVIAMGV